jgi:hypothetical protein
MFMNAAKEIGADKSGKAFKKALNKLVPKKRR